MIAAYMYSNIMRTRPHNACERRRRDQRGRTSEGVGDVLRAVEAAAEQEESGARRQKKSHPFNQLILSPSPRWVVVGMMA